MTINDNVRIKNKEEKIKRYINAEKLSTMYVSVWSTHFLHKPPIPCYLSAYGSEEFRSICQPLNNVVQYLNTQHKIIIYIYIYTLSVTRMMMV